MSANPADLWNVARLRLADHISQTDAALLGLTVYTTGKPCRRGHLCGRYVTNGTCVECSKGAVLARRGEIKRVRAGARSRGIGERT